MVVVLFINGSVSKFDETYVYDYTEDDKVLENQITKDYVVIYSGQRMGRKDYQLCDAIKNSDTFKIYYRKKTNTPFTYLGSTNFSEIIQERQNQVGTSAESNQRLKITLKIPAKNIVKRVVETHHTGIGMFKKPILEENNFEVDECNLFLGFYAR